MLSIWTSLKKLPFGKELMGSDVPPKCIESAECAGPSESILFDFLLWAKFLRSKLGKDSTSYLTK